MAQLIQCDFCGNITNQIAAAININLADSTREIPNTRRDYNSYSYVKDCCESCLGKFLETKPVPLAITPSGEAVKSEDL